MALPLSGAAMVAGKLVLAVLALSLAATIVAGPVRHDEQIFVTAALLYDRADLYRDLGFNHLPNLPVLLNLVAFLTDHWRPMLVFRFVIVLAWLATFSVLAWMTWRATRSQAMTLLVCLLLIANPLLGGSSGILVTNNFMPLPFALGGLALFLREIERPVRPWVMAVVGLLLAIAVGMKANYILLVPPFAVAALSLPAGLPLSDRLRRVVLPLLIGGVAGGLPTLAVAAGDPALLVEHVLGYHRGPHLAWAAASHEPLVLTMRDRLSLGLRLWGGGANLTLALATVAVAAQLWLRGWRPGGPILLAMGLIAAGILVSFLPRPAFPQYFAPPLPFALALLVLLLGAQTVAERRAMTPMFAAVALLTLATEAPRLVEELPAIANPQHWTGNSVHRISTQVAATAHGRPVATLSPIYAVDAGAGIYPELAAGPFLYRVADLIQPEKRRFWRTVSPSTLAARLDAEPPGAILVGGEGALDDAFRAYALQRGYVRVTLDGEATRYGELELYAPTIGSMSTPPPTLATSSSRSSVPRR